ncbi:MAG: DUF2975 domain-containing protein [Planctomycetota bacterium]
MSPHAPRTMVLLRVVLAVAWWATVAVVAAVVVGLILSGFVPGALDVWLTLTAPVVLTHPDRFVVTSGLAQEVGFAGGLAVFQLGGPGPTAHWLVLAAVAAHSTPLLIALAILRRFVRDAARGHFFDGENARRLRRIGITLIAGAIVVTITQWVLCSVLAAHLHSPDLTIDRAVSLHFEGLIAGLVFLVLAEAFRVGAALREESDHTV